jgi:hypothetical protein
MKREVRAGLAAGDWVWCQEPSAHPVPGPCRNTQCIFGVGSSLDTRLTFMALCKRRTFSIPFLSSSSAILNQKPLIQSERCGPFYVILKFVRGWGKKWGLSGDLPHNAHFRDKSCRFWQPLTLFLAPLAPHRPRDREPFFLGAGWVG